MNITPSTRYAAFAAAAFMTIAMLLSVNMLALADAPSPQMAQTAQAPAAHA